MSFKRRERGLTVYRSCILQKKSQDTHLETNEKEDYHGWTRLILNSGVPQAALRKATSSLMKPKTSLGVPVLASKILLFLSFQRFQTVYMMIAATFLLCRPVTAAKVLCHQSTKETSSSEIGVKEKPVHSLTLSQTSRAK